MTDYLDLVNTLISIGDLHLLAGVWREAAFRGAQGLVVRALLEKKTPELAETNSLPSTESFTELLDMYDARYVRTNLQQGNYKELFAYLQSTKGTRIPLLILENLDALYIQKDENLYKLFVDALLRTYQDERFEAVWKELSVYYYSNNTNANIDAELLEDELYEATAREAWNWLLSRVAGKLLVRLKEKNVQELTAKMYSLEPNRGLSGEIAGRLEYGLEAELLDGILLEVYERSRKQTKNFIQTLLTLVRVREHKTLSVYLLHAENKRDLSNLARVFADSLVEPRRGWQTEVRALPSNNFFFEAALSAVKRLIVAMTNGVLPTHLYELRDALKKKLE